MACVSGIDSNLTPGARLLSEDGAPPFLRCRRLTLPSWLVPATQSPVLGDSRLSREAEESS